MTTDRIEAPRLERLPAVCARVGVKRSTLYRWIADNKFPAPVRIGDNSVAWDSRAVDRWIAARISASHGQRSAA